MTSWYPLAPEIDLHVEDRIEKSDADRQTCTAREILHRLHERPGVILADEVGMGKTFVALAVAASVALSDRRRRPVVVMVPSSLQEKWPADFELFREKCLPPHLSRSVRSGKAGSAVDFLKLLDDGASTRCRVIFLTHGAMSHGLNDGWVKLALIYQALYRRKIGQFRDALCRVMGRLLRMTWVDRRDPAIWRELLGTPPGEWLAVMRARGFDPEGRGAPEEADDPVPEAVVHALERLDLDDLLKTLKGYVPLRQSKYFDYNLEFARQRLKEEIRRVWGECIGRLRIKVPLLILDEAHHLKNAQTRLASLFQEEEARSDAEEIARGPLQGVFERMLFLTATPFQLGHHELCSVLERFEGVNWRLKTAPPIGREGYLGEVADVRAKLDRAQEAAVALDHAWGQLDPKDLAIGGELETDVERWWSRAVDSEDLTPAARSALAWHRKTADRMRDAGSVLRPWVIRHLRQRQLPPPHEQVPRRVRLCGKAIVDEQSTESPVGIGVDDRSLLPFLLAARATACTPESRPVFAEGLASSYEAFLHTRKRRSKSRAGNTSFTDDDDDPAKLGVVDDRARWYLDQLSRVLPRDQPGEFPSHPKLSATVQRVVDAWGSGEKVVVFCHYIQTGKALRQWISQSISEEIAKTAAEKLDCDPSAAAGKLDLHGKRFFDRDSPVRRACDEAVGEILRSYPSLDAEREAWTEIIRRNLRTPSFLARYFPLRGQLTADSMQQALQHPDGSGLTLRELLDHFFEFLEKRSGARDRERYRDAMKGLQTGSHFGFDVGKVFESDELQGDRSERLLPNVRLINGSTGQETRQRLMLTFNTPFYPEVLVASSVMAEGVDLHLSCRHVIHHDLCWNPSTLEQRTGRVDRIGAKVEQCHRSIRVYLPFVAETQDEKMYRVVMDRERWFNVVMGESYQVDARTTDQMAERIPLPESVARELSFRLEVWPGGF